MTNEFDIYFSKVIRMPLYEYQCKNCGEINEILMKISDPNPENCEICEKGPLVKIMSRTHFVLKGEGWYETDFKDKKSHSGSAKSSKKSDDGGQSSSDKKDAASGGGEKPASGGDAKATSSTKSEKSASTSADSGK